MNLNFKEIKTKSNLLSLVRLFMAIPFWFLLDNIESVEIRYFTVGFCLLAAATDILDGFLARKYNEVTEFGKIIDPLADKVVVAIIILKLFLIGRIETYYFLMIICRDLIIFFGGILVSNKIGRVLPSNMLGKITVINISIVILMILLYVNKANLIFMFFYYLSIILMIASLIGYAIRAKEFILQNEYGTTK
jgi:CDP-diacylglycerol--glycerol-3-phosphate 3-phosphatidyltransferase